MVVWNTGLFVRCVVRIGFRVGVGLRMISSMLRRRVEHDSKNNLVVLSDCLKKEKNEVLSNRAKELETKKTDRIPSIG